MQGVHECMHIAAATVVCICCAPAARVTVKDTAAKLERHTNDPTMYTVHPVSGPTTLFHDPSGLVDQLRTHLKTIQPVWCTKTAGAHILPLVISGSIKVRCIAELVVHHEHVG